jgi:GNAT superfamily N-acetyltransferase
MVIGTDPAVRGAGLGQALMRSRLDRCDAEHAPAYLEATKPDLVPPPRTCARCEIFAIFSQPAHVRRS